MNEDTEFEMSGLKPWLWFTRGGQESPPLRGWRPSNHDYEQENEVEELSKETCQFLLTTKSLGRIAFNVKGEIEIFPINYAIENGVVVFRTGVGKKLDNLEEVSMAFEVDDYDLDKNEGWSVILKGHASEVTSDQGRAGESLRRAKVTPLAPGEKWHWFAIYPTEITGRRFLSRALHMTRN